MLKKIERKPLDFTSFPKIIQAMVENSADTATIIDKLIELKGENSLIILIILDDMNIRGVQISSLFKMCDNNVEKFYNKVINMNQNDIDKLNKKTVPFSAYKAVFNGSALERSQYPNKYIFTNNEREKLTSNPNINKKDLFPTITIDEALNIIKSKGFTCGYKSEYINDHNQEIYYVFYNEIGDILYTIASENKNLFLWKSSKLLAMRYHNHKNIYCEIELKDHPFKFYDQLPKTRNSKFDLKLPVIKTEKGIKYKEKNHSYTSCITASIYDLLSFENLYNKFDKGLKKLYEPMLQTYSNRAYDEIINHLIDDDGIKIAIDLQNVLGYSLSKTKLLKAKDRFCINHGYQINKKRKKFVSKLIPDDPYTEDINHRIINVLKHDIEKVTD